MFPKKFSPAGSRPYYGHTMPVSDKKEEENKDEDKEAHVVKVTMVITNLAVIKILSFLRFKTPYMYNVTLIDGKIINVQTSYFIESHVCAKIPILKGR